MKDSTSRCNAKTRHGTPCLRYPLKGVKNGRCRLHGGLSTGAKTKAGKEKQRLATTKHGYYKRETMEQRKQLRELLQLSKELAMDRQLFSGRE